MKSCVQVLLVSMCLWLATASAQEFSTAEMDISPLSFVFDANHILSETLEVYPNYRALSLDRGDYAGTVVFSSEKAVVQSFLVPAVGSRRSVAEQAYCRVSALSRLS